VTSRYFNNTRVDLRQAFLVADLCLTTHQGFVEQSKALTQWRSMKEGIKLGPPPPPSRKNYIAGADAVKLESISLAVRSLRPRQFYPPTLTCGTAARRSDSPRKNSLVPCYIFLSRPRRGDSPRHITDFGLSLRSGAELVRPVGCR